MLQGFQENASVILPLARETATIRKRSVERERVTVRTTVETNDDAVSAVLQVTDMTVEHVAVNRVVEATPAIREENGVTIIPVMEERLVIRTELVLREEIHVRRITRLQPTQQTVRLRREVAAIERHACHPINKPGENTMAVNSIPTHSEDVVYQGTTTPAMPPAHENQIVALYDTRAEAQAAMDKLTAERLGQGAHISDDAGGATAPSSEDQGVWASIKRLFAPEEEAHGYAEGLRRGHALLIVHPDAADRSRVIDVLETTNPIDFDAKVAEWRQAGWSAPMTADADTRAMSDRGGMAGGPASAMPTASTPSSAGTPAAANPGKLELMQERLQVGKRDVSLGGLRVRSYMVERPVEENVTLHEESVHLDRRPVDRALAPGETAFQDRSVEMTARGEEAVVEKQARVVEEIALRKDAMDRTQTVHDTVRHTEVEVDDTRTGRSEAVDHVAAEPPLKP